MDIAIVPVQNGADLFEAFLDLPWRIYPRRCKWIPPLKKQVRLQLSEHNLYFRHGEAQPFVALADGVVCGRIVASMNAHLAVPEKTGFFGYLEIVEDREACQALLEAARIWLEDRGAEIIYGPVDLDIYTGYRLLTEGFETEPFYGEPRHPHYYNTLLTLCGCVPHAVWKSYELGLPEVETVFNYLAKKMASFRQTKCSYRSAPLDLTSFASEIAVLHPLMMACFRGNFAYTELDFAEFIQRFGSVKEAALLELLVKVVHDKTGQTVAFSYGYQDHAEAFKRANGDNVRPEDLAASTGETVIGHTIAVHPDHRHGEPIYRLMRECTKQSMLLLNHRFKRVISALVKDDGSPNFMDLAAMPTRRYTIFQYGE